MKRKQSFLEMMVVLMLAMFTGGLIAYAAGAPPLYGFVGGFTIPFALGFVTMPEMSFRAGLFKEIWISKVMENFYSNWDFLMRSEDMTSFVENNTINLAEAGVDPEVLVNNNTYPIEIVEQEDTALPIPLDYFDTKNTVVRNAEAVQLVYNKLELVVKKHRNSLSEKSAMRAAHAWAPVSDDDFTPVIAATGADRGDGTKALTLEDIATAQERLDNILCPQAGRVLLLSPKHRSDLLKADKTLFKQFTNLKKGEVLPLCGFDIMWSQLVPKYNKNTGVKVALGAAPAATDAAASMFWLDSEVMRADGTADMFSRLKDPEARGDIVGFQKRFVALPIRNKYIGAIYSATV